MGNVGLGRNPQTGFSIDAFTSPSAMRPPSSTSDFQDYIETIGRDVQEDLKGKYANSFLTF
jgi:hypothetical protein